MLTLPWVVRQKADASELEPVRNRTEEAFPPEAEPAADVKVTVRFV